RLSANSGAIEGGRPETADSVICWMKLESGGGARFGRSAGRVLADGPAEGLEQGAGKLVGAVEGLRMPLHPDLERRRVRDAHGLDDAIRGNRLHQQAIPDPIDPLAVEGVHHHFSPAGDALQLAAAGRGPRGTGARPLSDRLRLVGAMI